jgi:hypothetical protein
MTDGLKTTLQKTAEKQMQPNEYTADNAALESS